MIAPGGVELGVVRAAVEEALELGQARDSGGSSASARRV